MSDSRTFLDQQFASLEREEQIVREVLPQLKTIEDEFRAEENHLVIFEKIARRLRTKIAFFESHILPLIEHAIRQARANQGQIQYDSSFDGHLRLYAEIEFDYGILQTVWGKIDGLYLKQFEDNRTKDKFFQVLSKEVFAGIKFQERMHELLFGRLDLLKSIRMSLSNMKGRNKNSFVAEVVEEMKREFKEYHRLV
ncbi:hypothetical protein HYY71_03305 [Candidatus Woesearchaeota archaeon]|nr:hypothetical protein [Candidatus Woesearchaeota archaeon]